MIGLLNTIPLQTLAGVGASLSERLAKLGLYNVQDLLLHLPLRYEDRTRVYPIRDLTVGMHANIEGEIRRTEVTFGKKPMLICHVADGTGMIALRFIHFNAGMKNRFVVGQKVVAFGEVKRGKRYAEMIHPQFFLAGLDNQVQVEEHLTPIYPTTEGIRQTTFRNLTQQALKLLERYQVDELLPAELGLNLLSLTEALALIHRPTPDVQLSQLEKGQHPAQKRLIFEELIAHQLSMRALRQKAQSHQAMPLEADQALVSRFLQLLPFEPTQAQRSVVNDIYQDMAKTIPMMRLVQGDVGSGKTLVAALAALSAISQGKQVALMAPTELLAEQHANNFRHWFEPLGITVGWLAGKQKGKARQAQMALIASGQALMVIGTHAIFQQEVAFLSLGLVIIDEQHRFGVHQRLSLWEKGQTQTDVPHQLIMTATPIPRTLAMTAYADLDTSVIDELPPGRTPIKTVVIADSRRLEVIERVRQGCKTESRQAYWVCTLIEESEVLEAQAAEATAEELHQLLPDLTLGLVHGRMKAQEKQVVMEQFKQGLIDVLIATTVIEVGVDVPNASLMIIENPERLGLAQLHQLRGRVGRGAVASHCVLLYKSPLSKTAQKRLQVLRDNTDGFVIAQYDLEIRGPGELLGTKQTGAIEFKVADLVRDQGLLPQVHCLANQLAQDYPQQAESLVNRWVPQHKRYTNA